MNWWRWLHLNFSQLHSMSISFYRNLRTWKSLPSWSHGCQNYFPFNRCEHAKIAWINILQSHNQETNYLEKNLWWCDLPFSWLHTIKFHHHLTVDAMKSPFRKVTMLTPPLSFQPTMMRSLPSSQFCNRETINFPFDSNIEIDLLKPFSWFRNCQLQTNETLCEPLMPSTLLMYIFSI